MRRSLVGPIVYALTIGLAFVSAAACFVVYALIALYFAAGPSSRIATPDDRTPGARRCASRLPTLVQPVWCHLAAETEES